MRKSLWIILAVLFVTFVVPNAYADSVADTQYTITCCNGGKPPMTDLEITWSDVISSISFETFGVTGTCTQSFTVDLVATSTTLTCPKGIPAGARIVEMVAPNSVKFKSACWSKGGVCVESGNLTPAPEPAPGGLILLGIGLVLLMRKRTGRSLPQH